MISQAEKRAFEEGVSGYWKSQGNPYDINMPQWHAWENGFDHASLNESGITTRTLKNVVEDLEK